MKTVKRIVAAVAIIGFIIGAFWLGRVTAPGENSTVFYARVLEISDSGMLVEGLSVNDINHRGQFRFAADKGISIVWHNTEISWDTLQPGDTVSVTYTGAVQETYPAGIQKVLRIELLDDER